MMRTTGSCAIILAALLPFEAPAQFLKSPSPATNASFDNALAQHTVALTLPRGTPLQVALDSEVRVKKVGQPIQGHLMQPVYAFDRLVLPVGTRVRGQISKIGRPSGKELTWSILNADFSPTRPIEVSFDQIVPADGMPLPLHAAVVPGSGQVINLVDAGSAKSGGTKNPFSSKMDEAKQEWRQAMQQINQPDMMHRAFRLGVAQLPLHPQYIDAGTLYNVELQEPLNFGSEAVKEETLQSIGTPPPPGSLVGRPGGRRSGSLSLNRDYRGAGGPLAHDGYPHERLRRQQVYLYELFQPRPQHHFPAIHHNEYWYRRPNRSTDADQPLTKFTEA